MSELQRSLRETARQLLAEESIEVMIGYERGTLPLRTTPCFIRNPDHVDRLVWNVCCENNLAKYLYHAAGKVGIVAKGCDIRSIVEAIVEQQIHRDDVVIIGMPCQGIIDHRAIETRLDGREVLEAHIANEQIVLHGTDFEEISDIQELLCDGCATCHYKNPPLHDILIGEPNQSVESPAVPVQEHPTVQTLESWTADERWAYFVSQFSRCIRCYACRQACPCCYCEECFVDQTQPSWFGKSDDLSDVMAFHIVRAYHVAGRCIDCGACARACPMHIDLRTLGRKLEKDVCDLYGYRAGLDLKTMPLLSTFRIDDPQEFIK